MEGKLRAVVVDDEHLNREGLKNKLRRKAIIVVGEADSAAAARELILALTEAQALDVVFLDIQMEGETSGLDLGRSFRAFPRPPRLVFVTAHPEYMNYVWPCHPDYFLQKPVDESELECALVRVREELGRRPPRPVPTPPRSRLPFRHAYVNQHGEKEWATTFICPKDLLYVRTSPRNGTLELHVADGTTLDGVRLTLKELEPQLAPHGFFPIHRSFLVNLAQIYCLKPGAGDDAHRAVIRGVAADLPVAREKWDELIKALERDWGSAIQR